MNLPNALTTSRFFMAGAMMVLLFAGIPWGATFALLVFGLAALTDALDGRLARSVYGVTAFGALLDPLADKVLVCAAFVSFVQMSLVPAWIVVLILSREFLVTGLRVLAASQGRSIAAGAWGKHKTIGQIVVIVALLAARSAEQDLLPRIAPGATVILSAILPTFAYAVALAAATITVASGIIYFHQHRDLIAEHM